MLLEITALKPESSALKSSPLTERETKTERGGERERQTERERESVNRPGQNADKVLDARCMRQQSNVANVRSEVDALRRTTNLEDIHHAETTQLSIFTNQIGTQWTATVSFNSVFRY